MGRGLRKQLLLGVCASLMFGCAGRVPVLSHSDVPNGWDQAAPTDAPLWPAKTWWHGFGSAELDTLIEAAQNGNLTLAAAVARVRQADARARQAGANLLPVLAINASGTHQYGRSAGTSAHETDFSAGVGASYELDFWGKIVMP